jgi:hypothetical protein
MGRIEDADPGSDATNLILSFETQPPRAGKKWLALSTLLSYLKMTDRIGLYV